MPPYAVPMSSRIGVDVGGTFTDLVWYDEARGEVVVAKQPTSPEAPEQGVVAALDAALAPGQLGAARWFLHGTTVGLNALLERRGATVGLVATDGFRDTLEVRRGDRDDPYDLFWHAPPPLVPRRLRLPVRGRILATGAEHAPLADADVGAAAAAFAAAAVDSVAVCLLNAYANPAHELAVERLLREAGFTGPISLSHRVSGEYREYERTCTTVVDAFVRRRMGPYLGNLASALHDRGFAGQPLITRSGGGAMTFAQAVERPFETVISGPVAGAAATAELARTLGLASAIAADVGGTSFDTCLVTDGELPLLYQGTVIGLPLQTPWVDVRSIGAGGGSIAHVDAGGLLRVGPRSAGAVPGPAAYGRGGIEPTVTDAAVALGLMPAGAIAGGVVLSRERAEAALASLVPRVGFASVSAVARGVLRIAAAGMAEAIRGVTVEQGRDPREAALVAFGGAGPLFATLLADELDIDTFVVPPHAGNFSAWGLLGADLVQAAARTRLLRLDDAAIPAADAVVAELFAELAGRGAAGAAASRAVHLDLRYVGQEHTLTIAVPGADGRVRSSAAELCAIFEDAYGRTFGITIDEEVELVCVRAVATEPLPRPGRAPATPPRPPPGRSPARRTSPSRSSSARRSPRVRSPARRSYARPRPRRTSTQASSPRCTPPARCSSGGRREARARRLPRRPGQHERRPRRRPGDDRDRPSRARLGGRPDEARARPDGVLARDLRGPRLRCGDLRPRRLPARPGAEPADVHGHDELLRPRRGGGGGR